MSMYPELLSEESSKIHAVLSKYPRRCLTDKEDTVRQVLEISQGDTSSPVVYPTELLERISKLECKMTFKLLTCVMQARNGAADATRQLLALYPYVSNYKLIFGEPPGDLMAMYDGIDKAVFTRANRYIDKLIELMEDLYTPPTTGTVYMLYTLACPPSKDLTTITFSERFNRIALPVDDQYTVTSFFRENPIDTDVLNTLVSYSLHPLVSVTRIAGHRCLKVKHPTLHHSYLMYPAVI